MKKDLPKIYSLKVDKDTNSRVSYTKNKDEVIKEDNKIKKQFNITKSVEDKINEIFSNISYVYKMDVVIKTNDGEFVKQLVGRNNKAIITMDNEQIPINTIKEIYIKEKK
jgi:hypothetical protein